MSDSTGELILKVQPDLGGLRRIQALISELSTVAKASATGARSTVQAATAQMKKLEQSTRGVYKAQSKLNKAIRTGNAKGAAAVKKTTAATDRHTRAVTRATKANTAYRGSIRGVTGALGGLWLSYTSLIPTIAAFGAAMSLRKAIKDGAEFTYQMRAVQGISQSTAETMDKASDSILKLGESSLQGPMELAKGFRILAQAGFSAKDALVALPHVSALAVIGQMDLSSATVIASGAMHQFSLEASDMGHIVDVLSKSAASSATTVSQIGNALVYTAASATTLNIPLGELSAGIATLATRGVTASKAGTSLNRALLNISAGTPKTKAALKELGVEAFDATGKFRGMIPVFGDLNKALKGYSQEARVSFLKDILGFRGIKAAPIIDAIDKLKEFTEGAKGASSGLGFANENLVLLSQNAKGQAQLAFNTFEATIIRAGKGAEDALFAVAVAAKEMFKSKAFQDAMTSAIENLAAFTGLLIAHRGAILNLAKAYAVFKTASLASGLLGGKSILGGATRAVQGIKNMTTAVRILGTTMGPLAIMGSVLEASIIAPLMAFLATPPGWIVLAAAVTAAAAAFYLFSGRAGEAASAKMPSIKPMLDQMKELAEAQEKAAKNKFLRAHGINPDVQVLAGVLEEYQRRIDLRKIALDQLDTRIATAQSSRVKNIGKGAAVTAAVGLVGAVVPPLGLASLVAAPLLGQKASGERELLRWQKERAKIVDELATSEGKYNEVRGSLATAKKWAKLAGITTDSVKEEVAQGKQRHESVVSTIKDARAQTTAQIEAVKLEAAAKQKKLGTTRAIFKDGVKYRADTVALTEETKDKLYEIEVSAATSILGLDLKTQEERVEALKAGNAIHALVAKSFREAELKGEQAQATRIIALAKKTAEGLKAAKQGADKSSAALSLYAANRGASPFRQSKNKQAAEETRLANEAIRGIAKAGDRVKATESFGPEREQEKADIIAKNNEIILNLKQKFEDDSTLVAQKGADERKQIIKEEAYAVVGGVSSIMGSIAGLIGDQTRKSFERSKKFRIAQATIDMLAGASSAYTDTKGGTTTKVIAAAAALAAGAVRVQQITKTQFQGQAHDGLPDVPNTGTYLLEKGERVVKQEDNKKLQRFLESPSQQNTSEPTQVIVNITAMDSVDVKRVLSGNEGLIQKLVQNGYNRRLLAGGPLG